MRKPRLALVVIGSFALATAPLAMGVASAASPSGSGHFNAAPTQGAILIYNSQGSVLWAGGTGQKKQEPSTSPAAGSGNTQISPAATQVNANEYILSNSYTETVTPPGGSSGPIDVGFDTTVTTTASWWNATYNGSSATHWWGSSPYLPTEIMLTDNYSVSGFPISVSYGGVGYSGSGSSVTWTSGWKTGYWELSHQYNNITFSGPILDIAQSEAGDYEFGSQYYTVNTSDSTIVGL